MIDYAWQRQATIMKYAAGVCQKNNKKRETKIVNW